MNGTVIVDRTFAIDGHAIQAKPLKAALYLVATPIGNLGDITLRALATLAAADIVACEDTRVTSVLFRQFGIASRLMPYHDHNGAEQRPKILSALAEGKSVALVSDAGTPLVSDPGYRLVGEVQAAGFDVVPIPGASALLAALVASGLPTDAFLFAGFLPPKTVARKKRLAELASVPATLVFFESPQRLAPSLRDMNAALGPRHVVVARELTKTFEQIRRGALADLAAAYAEEDPPKGEVVVVVSPPQEKATSAVEADRVLKSLLEEKSVSAAAAEAAEITGLPRRDLYQRALAMKDKRGRR
ncbi:MAG TPA: 16S rRNA (cytidine(1402)-2'-O)-methyltransferase [Bauldia sp.]|nr:16S rRNA (cytidine(1402)-2'-O)-methyltransferase [Bauldia sp.]